MKKIGTLNSHLSAVIASMGHTDRLVVCDSGLPIPHAMERVDLAVAANIPRFIDVLKVILQELKVEAAIIADEMLGHNSGNYEALMSMLPDVPIRKMPHEDFKLETSHDQNTVFVRTGEASPFANVILIAVVTFG